MAKPSDTPGFQALYAEWNKKLADSGFKDIEVMRHGELILKSPGTERRFKRLDEITREAKREYYRRLQEHVAKTHFESELERDVLNLYAQGVTQAAIKHLLSIQGHRCKVYYPIYKWLRRWGLK